VGLLHQEVDANNLANADSAGYKRDVVSFGTFEEVLLPRIRGENRQPPVRLPYGASITDQRVDFQEGPFKQTGNPFDIALEGDAFLAVEVPQPDGTFVERYTRAGHLTLGLDGNLWTRSGYRVLGEDGRPLAVAGQNLAIGQDGTVQVDGATVGRLRLVHFSNPLAVQKIGQELFAGATEPAVNVRVHQGTLETSNVEPVRTMVGMIANLRTYEAGQRMIQAQDQSLERVIDLLRR
jgi:flagellar basal-body rod protein FlgG